MRYCHRCETETRHETIESGTPDLIYTKCRLCQLVTTHHVPYRHGPQLSCLTCDWLTTDDDNQWYCQHYDEPRPSAPSTHCGEWDGGRDPGLMPGEHGAAPDELAETSV